MVIISVVLQIEGDVELLLYLIQLLVEVVRLLEAGI